MSDNSVFALPCPAGYGLVSQVVIIARSASYVGGCSQNDVSVRPLFVNKIIDFCEEYMNPRHMLLSTGSLKS